MSKNKIIFPTQTRYQSSYQLEECRRRLGYLKEDIQPIYFQQMNNDTIQFRLRRVELNRVSHPMIAFEISGTLRRWGGTGTALEDYQLKRLTARMDTWVVLFIVVSTGASLGLMLPAMLNSGSSLQTIIGLIVLACSICLLPIMAWAKHTLVLDIDQEIDRVHQAIMHELNISDST